MKKFIIENKVFERFPNLKVGVIVCSNVDNTIELENFYDDFDKVKNDVKEKFKEAALSEYDVIKKWREIYKSFGEKKMRSSVEALIKRTLNNKEIPKINPLVDLYNMISMKYEIPCGGEDLDKIDSDIELCYASGCEKFIPLGTDTVEIANEGEIIYKFGNTVICRNFNYRESDLTKLTDKTTNCILVLESIEDDNLEEAMKNLSSLVSEKLNGKVKSYILDKDASFINLEL